MKNNENYENSGSFLQNTIKAREMEKQKSKIKKEKLLFFYNSFSFNSAKCNKEKMKN